MSGCIHLRIVAPHIKPNIKKILNFYISFPLTISETTFVHFDKLHQAAWALAAL